MQRMAPDPAPRRSVASLLSSDNVRWIVTALVIPLTAWLWGQSQERQAALAREQAAVIANAQRNADLVIRLLPALSKAPGEPERENALAIVTMLAAKGDLDPALKAAFERVRGSLTPAEVEIVARNAPVSEGRADTFASAASEPTAWMQLPGARLYVQIFDERQRERAEAVQAEARTLNLAAPGVENVVRSASAKGRAAPQGYDAPVLLFFKPEDRATAERLAAALQAKLDLRVSLRDRSSNAAFAKVPAGQLELWFADPSRAGAR